MFKFKFITALALMMAINSFQGQELEAPLITDRPDATEAPNVVPLNSFQIETGGIYTNYETKETQEEVFAYNTMLIRYGLLSNFELRLGWNIEETRITDKLNEVEESFNGMSPLLAGMKVHVLKEDGWKPQIGLIGHLFLPFTASSDFIPETTGVDFRFSFAHTLSEKSSLSYNLGAEWGNDSPEVAYIYTLAYGHSLNNKIGVYLEVYGDFPEDNRANHYWDAGFTYLALPNLQFDVTFGSGITANQDLLLSTGLSYRIPK